MIVAVQGCSHGSLTAIYSTIAAYTERTSNTVDLLLLCGDFQALRSNHDFASLSVPPKYYALGTFHEYYSGKKVAPVLTLVIGGNHEASNYMWELYHGGWLAPNIYYLGAAGSVLVDGLRITGASGIYKDHDYRKGHHETVPYNNSTLRSVYHIRQYDVFKLLQLPPASANLPTISLSHDWPLSISRHGDLKTLLRRKPYFKSEIEDNTLGSPPLYELLRHLQSDWWFSAHLHVKFAAVVEHAPTWSEEGADLGKAVPKGPGTGKAVPLAEAGNPDEIDIVDDDNPEEMVANPDEINIEDEDKEAEEAKGNPDEINIEADDEDDAETIVYNTVPSTSAGPSRPEAQAQKMEENLDEIAIDDDDLDDQSIKPAAEFSNTDETDIGDEEALNLDESADIVERIRKEEHDPNAAKGVIGVLPTEGAEPRPSNPPVNKAPIKDQARSRQTKFLALDKCGPGKDHIQFLDIPTPRPTEDHRPRLEFDPHWLAITRALHPYISLQYQQSLPSPDEAEQLIQDELDRIHQEGLLVPSGPSDSEDGVKLEWEKNGIEIGRVQRFWPTAPAQGEPGGSPSAWYTNPQTEAFCGMLGIQNRINPAPRG